MLKIFKLFLVLLCMISIFLFSQDNAEESSNKSNQLILFVTGIVTHNHLTKEKEDHIIELTVTFVRKMAHFTIYFILGFLTISYFKESYPITWKMMFYTFLFCFFYACSDEVHQLFVPGRSGNIIDVGIDSFGSYLGILFYYLYLKCRRML